MVITRANDISVVLSGGTVNINVNDSLGGDPSSTPVTNNILNNLFDDVLPKETDEGHEDYRCIYFFNDGDTPIFLINIYIIDDFSDGATIEIGVEQRNETQRISINNGPITGGSFTLTFSGLEVISNYNSDLGVWAVELQNKLNNLLNDGEKLLKDVSINAQPIGDDRIIFDVNFYGNDGSRNQPKIQLYSNDLIPATSDISVSVPQEGAPINTIAAEIGLETTPPGNVGFFSPNELAPISFPRLNSGDGFPLWIKRVVAEGADPKEKDGFELRFSAETLEP